MPEQSAPTRQRPRRGRGWWIGGVVVIVVLACFLVAWVVLPALKSPSQAAAEALPPPPKEVTAKAQVKSLASQIVLRGAVVAGPSTPLKPSDALIAKAGYVTNAPLGSGSTINDGDVALEVNGDPVFALTWPFPAYRDLTDGLSGPDVVQLQKSLAGLGYQQSGTGVFDASTQAGLRQFYKDRGYKAPQAAAPQAPTAQAPAAQTPAGQAQGAKGGVQAPSGTSGSTTSGGTTPVLHTYLPAAAVLPLPASSAAVTELKVAVGSKMAADTVLMLLNGGVNTVLGAVTPDKAALIKAGNAAVLEPQPGAAGVPLVVSAVGKDTTDVPGLGKGNRLDFTFQDQASTQPVTPGGTTLKITLTIGGKATPVLAVPITAIFSNTDGSTFVRVQASGNGQGSATPAFKNVTVTVGQVVDGWAEITPGEANAVVDGSEVVVGLHG
ncbi:peptidoglycan-binding domain-containing protein [Psychromicrobium xiongbiense]|uniref:peptidoglycan-binding domain-containing protein n=1 Tax=Psychromicrobium xiongbiense TaxID=3051184 RepID=UPI00255537E0|nr:peptidoglycan-binding domain-containing protein [Psychromicrobium sp. YIM S02556]